MTAFVAARVRCDTFVLEEDLNGGIGITRADSMTAEAIWNTVKVAFDVDVIVGRDLCGRPRGRLEPRGRQRFERGRFARREHGGTRTVEFLEWLAVELLKQNRDGLVEFGKRMEHTASERCEDPAFREQNARFHLGLVARPRHARGHDGRAVVARQLDVLGIEVGLVAVGFVHERLGVVGHDQLRDAAEIFKRERVPRQPARPLLVLEGVHESEVAHAHHRYEQMRLKRAAGRVHGDCVTGKVHEGALARNVGLPHDEVERLSPGGI